MKSFSAFLFLFLFILACISKETIQTRSQLTNTIGNRGIIDSNSQGLSIYDIQTSLGESIKEHSAKLLAQSVNQDGLSMRLQDSGERILHLKVKENEDGFKINIQKDDKSDELSIMKKGYYKAEAKRFLSNALNQPKQERKLTSFTNYENMLIEAGFEKILDGPKTEDGSSGYYSYTPAVEHSENQAIDQGEVQNAQEHVPPQKQEPIGYARVFEEHPNTKNHIIYVEFSNPLISQDSTAIDKFNANLLFKIEAPKFAHKDPKKITRNEETLFKAQIKEGEEQFKQFFLDNPELQHRSVEEVVEKIKKGIQGLLNPPFIVNFEEEKNFVFYNEESDTSLIFTVFHNKFKVNVGTIEVNIFFKEHRFLLTFVGSANTIELMIPFYKLTRTFTDLRANMRLPNSILMQVADIYNTMIFDINTILDLFRLKFEKKFCVISPPEGQDENRDDKFNIKSNFEFVNHDNGDCELTGTKMTMTLFNYRRMKMVHLRFSNKYFDVGYGVNLTKKFSVGLDNVVDHLFLENNAITHDAETSSDNTHLDLVSLQNDLKRLAPKLKCELKEEFFIDCLLNTAEVLKIEHVYPGPKNPGAEYFRVTFIKPLTEQSDPAANPELAFPEIILQPVNGYEQLAPFSRQVTRFVKMLGAN